MERKNWLLSKKGKSKKGSITDVSYTAAALFAVAVTVLIVFTVYSNINTEFQASDKITSKGKDASSHITGMYPGVIDNSFLFIMIGLALIAFFLAAAVRVHPVFFVFYIIILAVIIVLAGVFSNAYGKMAEDPAMIAYSSQLTFITHIMSFLPIIVGIFGTLLAIVMFKTGQEERY